MLKFLFTLIFSLLFIRAFAQKRDTTVYYKDSVGNQVLTKDSAFTFVVILPPDTAVDKYLFPVREFFKNGKPLLFGSSTTDNFDLKFVGSRIVFFQNGHKSEVSTFENGQPIGDMMEYYPNGKLYNTRTFVPGKPTLFNECRDSTGNLMTENGNGRWIFYFDKDFHSSYYEGKVVKGHQEGKWVGRRNNIDAYVDEYSEGRMISQKILNQEEFSHMVRIQQNAEFPGGIKSFGRFIAVNTHYPEEAKSKGTKGTVIVSFIVEADGSLSNIKIVKGIGDGCDEEAIRVIKSSPRWRPGLKNSKPTRFAFTVPIDFPSVYQSAKASTKE